jgi:hypothetical protein
MGATGELTPTLLFVREELSADHDCDVMQWVSNTERVIFDFDQAHPHRHGRVIGSEVRCLFVKERHMAVPMDVDRRLSLMHLRRGLARSATCVPPSVRRRR